MFSTQDQDLEIETLLLLPLPISELLKLCLTNKHNRQLCLSNTFWEKLLKRDFPNFPITSYFSPKMLYKEAYLMKYLGIFGPDTIPNNSGEISVFKTPIFPLDIHTRITKNVHMGNEYTFKYISIEPDVWIGEKALGFHQRAHELYYRTRGKKFFIVFRERGDPSVTTMINKGFAKEATLQEALDVLNDLIKHGYVTEMSNTPYGTQAKIEKLVSLGLTREVEHYETM